MNRRKTTPAGRLSPLSSLKMRNLEAIRGNGAPGALIEKLDVTETFSTLLQEQETTRTLGHVKKRDSLSALVRSTAFLL